jgi:hypothetical protein
VTRTRRLPSPLIVPAITVSPGALSTGFDSPVTIASLTSDSPSTTSPSAGTLAPGRTSSRSPLAQRLTGTVSVPPSGDALGRVGHQFGQLVQRPRRLAHAAHLQPVAEQHDVDQRHQLPEEGLARRQQQRGQAVDVRDADGQRDQRHHPRLPVAQLGHGHRQEGHATVEEDNRAKDRRYPGRQGNLRRRKAQPHLQHLAVDQHRNAQDQRHPEAPPEHVLMTRMVHMRAVPGLPMPHRTVVHRRVVHRRMVHRRVVHGGVVAVLHPGVLVVGGFLHLRVLRMPVVHIPAVCRLLHRLLGQRLVRPVLVLLGRRLPRRLRRLRRGYLLVRFLVPLVMLLVLPVVVIVMLVHRLSFSLADYAGKSGFRPDAQLVAFSSRLRS